MKKIQVTPQQRANALEALNVFWPSIKPEQVAGHLHFWREDEDGGSFDFDHPPSCGTVACFGGWLEWYAPFRAQLGVAPDKGEIDFEDLHQPLGTGWQGEFNIFAERGGFKGDSDAAGEPFEGTDHELVSHRLRWWIENTEVAE